MLFLLVAVLCLGCEVKSQTNFPDTGVLKSFFNNADTDHSGKISPNEFTELFAGGKAGSQEIVTKIMKMIDQNGDNEASEEEIFNVIKKIIEFYIKLFDTNRDGSLSQEEFTDVSINVDGAINDTEIMAQILLDLADVNKDGMYSSEDHEDPNKLIQNDVKLLGFLKKALDQNEDHKLGKKEIKAFATTAIKLIDQNSDGTILLEELLDTLQKNGVSKKAVDHLRAQAKNKTIVNAWKNVFQKIDAQTKDKDKKLSADEVASLIKLPVDKLQTDVGESILPIYFLNNDKENPLANEDFAGALESFLKNKEFEKVNSIVNREPAVQEEPKNSSTMMRANLTMFVILVFKTFCACTFKL